MPGLLERAQLWLKAERKESLRNTPRAAAKPDDTGVTEDERRELVGEIEKLFAERRPIGVDERGKKRGGARFPLVVNAAAVAVLAAAVVVATQVIGNQSNENAANSKNFMQTEGLVIQAVKQKAASELSQRSARIAQIQAELNSLRGAAAAKSGAAPTARERQLENELANLRSNASQRLTNLQAERSQELFRIRQLQSIYQNVQADVAATKFDAAISNLGAAQQLLTTAAASQNGSLAAVAPALSAGNDVLRATLLYAQTETAAAHSSAIPAQIAAINQLVTQGDQRYTAGDLAGARDSYMQAITSLSSLSRAYDRLTSMTKGSYARQTARFDARIHALESQVSTLDAAIQARDRTIADQRNRLAAADTRISGQQRAIEAANLQLQKRSTDLATVVNSTFNAIHSASKPKVLAQVDSSGSVVDLLKTKVEIRNLAESEAARQGYPDLYKKLDPFFQGYAQTYADQGRSEALKQVASALNDVIVALNLHLPVAAPNSSAPSGHLETHTANQLSLADPISSYLSDVNQALDHMLVTMD